jgi:hypothetical protein
LRDPHSSMCLPPSRSNLPCHEAFKVTLSFCGTDSIRPPAFRSALYAAKSRAQADSNPAGDSDIGHRAKNVLVKHKVGGTERIGLLPFHKAGRRYE